MIIYEGILQKLLKMGWSTYRLQKERVLPNSVIIRIRKGEPITTTTLDTICKLCKCQPGDLLTYIPDTEEKEGE